MAEQFKNQPSAMPSRKVAAGGVAGILTVAALQLADLYYPGSAVLLTPLSDALAPVFIGFVTSYLVRSRA